MSALFRNSQKALNVMPGDVAALAEFVLTEEGASNKEVSILFVSNREITDLNAKYLSREGPTDVLAFPMHAGENDGPRNHAGAWLGDVVVSAERAVEYAQEHRLDPAEELSLYLVHGLLHLLGYDDADPRDRRKMRRRERELMQGARSRGILLRVETPETRADSTPTSSSPSSHSGLLLLFVPFVSFVVPPPRSPLILAMSETGLLTSFVLVVFLAAFSNWARLSLLSLRPSRLKALFGHAGTEEPDPAGMRKAEGVLLSTLVANNAAKVAAPLLLFAWLRRRAPALAPGWTFALAFLAAIACLLLFSELVPRIIVNSRRDVTLRFAILPLWLLNFLLLPITLALRRTSVFMAKILRRDVQTLAPWRLRAPANLMWDTEGREIQLQEDEKVLISSIYDMTETIVREVMIPRADMHCLEQNLTLAEACRETLQTAHSRLPVYADNLDNIVGLFLVKDLLRCSTPEQLANTKVKELMRPIHFVPETKKVSELLREFQRTRRHMAVVVDEYGNTAGLVTIQDLLEQIVGEIKDEHDTEQKLFVETKDGGFIVDAKMSVSDLSDGTGIELPENTEYDSVGGFVVATLGKVPQQGDAFQSNGVAVTVLEVDDRRVHRVKLVPLSQEESSSSEKKVSDQ